MNINELNKQIKDTKKNVIRNLDNMSKSELLELSNELDKSINDIELIRTYIKMQLKKGNNL